MHSSAFAFESKSLAEKNDKASSALYMSLNGTWKFHWVQDPRKRPVDFYSNDFDDKSWDDFKVPANWELNGYGLPIYVNQPHEFAGHAKRGRALNPPFDIPEDNNPVGSYRKKIMLPEHWKSKQVFIHLGAVKSAFFLWVNGKKVGYSEDSKLAAEFDITPFVHAGENLIALQVYRWSDASYLECQDMWRISGIERDVYLYATPKIHIRDFKVQQGLVNNYTTGDFALETEVVSYKTDSNTLHSRPDTCSLGIELLDPSGKKVYEESTTGVHKVLGRYKATARFAAQIPDVKQWSAEIPNLYTLYISLKDKHGDVIEVVRQKIGFRSIELINNNLLVNGKRVFFKGVNRHEHDPKLGHAITRDDMRKDMEMMKKLNVNAVRHSHYPPDPYWLELCDEYGLYVVDEANIESHGVGYDLSYTLGNKPEWREPHLQRIQRMYERDKNHTSVIFWSLGNEAGNGINFYEAYEWLKQKDTMRPVQYERAEYDYNTDLIVPQYPSPPWLVRYANSNPSRALIMSEYAHIMGNSLGNFKEYWDAIENNPNLQGGFIWEWIDQGIDTVKNGKRIMAYGGDFPLEGPVPHNISDNNFCIKGVVTAYRQLTPMAVEIKKVHQFIATKLLAGNTLEITNKYFFRDISNVMLRWELMENGLAVSIGAIENINAAARQTATVSLPITYAKKSGKEYHLNIHYELKSQEPFLEKHYEVAYEQFDLSKTLFPKTTQTNTGKILVKRSNTGFDLTGKGFSLAIDTINGTVGAYKLKGKTIIDQGPKPAFWRAPTDNDIGAGFNKSLRQWRNAYDEGKIIHITLDQQPGGSYEVGIEKSLLNGDVSVFQLLTVYANGTVHVSNHMKPLKGDHKVMMRYGNDLTISHDLQMLSWFGRGPWENYWDRHTASLTGVYNSTVDAQYFPYARPQESGNKSDVRWFSLKDKTGRGIEIVFADSLLNVAALPYSMDDLDPETDKKQYHSGELVKRNNVYLHVDLQQMGVQGMDSWGAWPLEEYRLKFAPHSYSYWIFPVQ